MFSMLKGALARQISKALNLLEPRLQRRIKNVKGNPLPLAHSDAKMEKECTSPRALSIFNRRICLQRRERAMERIDYLQHTKANLFLAQFRSVHSTALAIFPKWLKVEAKMAPIGVPLCVLRGFLQRCSDGNGYFVPVRVGSRRREEIGDALAVTRNKVANAEVH